MWHDLFVQQIPFMEKALRTVIVYALILVLFRLAGQRGLASLNRFDLVVLLLLAGVVENALVGDDTSLTGAAIGAVTLVAAHRGLTWLADTNQVVARLFEGKPAVVIEDGKMTEQGMRKLGMRGDDLDHAVRSQHGDDIQEVEHGELTPSGQLVLTLKPEEQSATRGDIADLSAQWRHLEQLVTAGR